MKAAPESRKYPAALQAPLERFLFDADQWVMPRALLRDLGCADEADFDAAMSRQAIRTIVAQRHQVGRLSVQLLAGDLRWRLALAPRDDWLRLGLCASLLPYCGRIRNSMDGHFRRVVREQFETSAIDLLEEHGGVGDLPVFLAGAGAWRKSETVALGGIRSMLEQACGWPVTLRRRFNLQFEPEELDVSPSVGGLNGYWLEVVCRTMFPESHWLWS